jgi:hypothetical protein
VSDEVELNPVETQASAKGWKPKEEFDADPKNDGKVWRSAEDFVDRQSFFDKIDEQHRRIKDLEKGLRAQAEYNARVEKLAYDKAVKDLKFQKRDALENNDLVRADELDEQIETIKEQAKKVVIPQQPVVQEEPPAFKEWRKQNTWYDNDQEMHNFADWTANNLSARGVIGDELLEKVTEAVKTTFAAKFRNPNKDKARSMEKGSPAAKTVDNEQLSPEEEHLIRTMVRAGVPHPTEKRNMTVDEYRGQLKKLKGA